MLNFPKSPIAVIKVYPIFNNSQGPGKTSNSIQKNQNLEDVQKQIQTRNLPIHPENLPIPSGRAGIVDMYENMLKKQIFQSLHPLGSYNIIRGYWKIGKLGFWCGGRPTFGRNNIVLGPRGLTGPRIILICYYHRTRNLGKLSSRRSSFSKCCLPPRRVSVAQLHNVYEPGHVLHLICSVQTLKFVIRLLHTLVLCPTR